MNIAEIIKKVLAGEELSAAEKEALGKADFNDVNRIPKARLDQEIEKRKAAEATATELQSKLDELTTKVDELENKGLSEVEKAKKESEKAIAQLKSEVSTLSKEHFANSEYLDFLTTSKNLDISNEQATAGFFQELEKSSPELFRSTAKPGGGTVGTGQTGSGTVAAETRIKELLNKPELSSREASEVIKLQNEINSATPDKS